MKSILICPAESPDLERVSEQRPLALQSFFGKELIVHWIDYLAARGATEIIVLATDRPHQIRQKVGSGAQWGVRLEILPEMRTLDPESAREKYKSGEASSWMPTPWDANVLNRLPIESTSLIIGYRELYEHLREALPIQSKVSRLGSREIAPGVWIGLRTRVAASARLVAPVWIGDDVLIGSEAVVGPDAILENRIVVEKGAEVAHSWVAPDTMVGELTNVAHSLAIGNVLVDWRSGSWTRVPDPFLLCSLGETRRDAASNWLGRLTALGSLVISAPVILPFLVRAQMRGHRWFKKKYAVLPQSQGGGTVAYKEVSGASGLWKRWPQLFNIVKGEFAWVGNRPLSPGETAQLSTDFDRLWLAAPIGLFSQADAEGCDDLLSDESRAHSSFYAAQSHWRADLQILGKILSRRTPRPSSPPSNTSSEFRGNNDSISKTLGHSVV